MEKFLDETIVEFKRKIEQEEFNSVETGVYVNNRLITFEKVELFEQKMSVELPKGMTLMPLEQAMIKYPSVKRPQLIYTNEDGSVNFTFSHFDLEIKQEQTLQAAKQFQNILKKINPANIFYEMVEETLDKAKLSWFDFKSYTIEDPSYNITYVTPLKGTVMHGAFNCPFNDGSEWKQAAKLVMTSIKDLTIKKELKFHER